MYTCNPMHHHDRNIHRLGFRYPSPERQPKHTWNALRWLRVLAAVLLALLILGLLGIHP